VRDSTGEVIDGANLEVQNLAAYRLGPERFRPPSGITLILPRRETAYPVVTVKYRGGL